MLKLVKTPVPQYSAVESQLYGRSATNPVVIDSDSDSVDARVEDFEEESIQLDSDEGVVKAKDETELAEKDLAAEGVVASTWANQVTLNPNPYPNPNPQPTTHNPKHHRC